MNTALTDRDLLAPSGPTCDLRLWHGRRSAAKTFGVSRHTLWRFLERGHVGRAIPSAVLNAVGGSVEAVDAATRELAAGRPVRRRDPAPRPLPQALEDTLLLVCAAPLATVGKLARFSRVPASTLRERLGKLSERGLADSVAHRLGVLGPHPQRRYFPTEQGIDAGGRAEHGRETFLREYPVSRRWFQLLVERLDAIAVLYYVAALVADADPHETPLPVDHYRQGVPTTCSSPFQKAVPWACCAGGGRRCPRPTCATG